MEICNLSLTEVKLLKPKVHFDNRGELRELYNQETFKSLGLNDLFLQDNFTKSKKFVLRGLHYQISPFSHVKLISCLKGSILDIVLDIRKSSKTFGQHLSIELNEEKQTLLLIPEGFAHGYLTLSDEAWVSYKLSSTYKSTHERGINALDASLGLNFPFKKEELILSQKDLEQPNFQEQKDLFD